MHAKLLKLPEKQWALISQTGIEVPKTDYKIERTNPITVVKTVVGSGNQRWLEVCCREIFNEFGLKICQNEQNELCMALCPDVDDQGLERAKAFLKNLTYDDRRNQERIPGAS